MVYEVSREILDKYADVLINFGLGEGKGAKKGEVVYIQCPECAKPFLISLRRAVLKAGAIPIIDYSPDNIAREYYELASDEQIKFFPAKLLRGRVDEIDHVVSIAADSDIHELEGVSPHKLMLRQAAFRPYMEWRNEKENAGKLTWTLAMYGTEAMAKEAKMSLEQYWAEIRRVCFLDEANPVKKWKEVFGEIIALRKRLDALKIEKVHVIAEGIDFYAGIGKGRRWLGGTGANIPSFEVYISPDCRKTNGKISFDMPLYRYGNVIEGIELEFRNGKVVGVKASKGEKVLREMIGVKGANMIGEFSLTDTRFSKIDKFMAETLFDENFGGKFGNMHIALGNAYRDSYPGNPASLSEGKWKKLGYNKSVIHTDIFNISPKEVIATLPNGQEKTIYKDGHFLV
jgi:aminopeptidase